MHQVSPSQIATAQQCLRRWYYQSVLGFKQPDTAATQFGSAVHAALEGMLLEDSWPALTDAEVLRRAEPAYEAFNVWLDHALGVSHIEQFQVEMDWSLPASAELALPARGRIDLVLSQANAALDWKTTSDVRYIKSADTLATDPQVILYTDALVKTGLLTLPSTFLHVYTVTRGKPQARVVQTHVTAESLSIGRARINETLLTMQPFVDQQTPVPAENVPGNILACGDYGGCPHRFRCFPEPNKEEPVSAEDIKAKLAARRAAQAGVVNPPVVAAGPEAVVVVEAPSKTASVFTEPATVKTEQPKAANQRVLFLGCAPLLGNIGEPTLFDEWVQPLVKQVQGSLKVAHWGLADYGKGKAAIVALVADAASRGDIPNTLVLDRRSSLGDACVEVLVPFYSLVVSKLG